MHMQDQILRFQLQRCCIRSEVCITVSCTELGVWVPGGFIFSIFKRFACWSCCGISWFRKYGSAGRDAIGVDKSVASFLKFDLISVCGHCLELGLICSICIKCREAAMAVLDSGSVFDGRSLSCTFVSFFCDVRCEGESHLFCDADFSPSFFSWLAGMHISLFLACKLFDNFLGGDTLRFRRALRRRNNAALSPS